MDIGHPICFLLLCDKLPHTHLLSYHFSESGLWTQLSWILCLGSHKTATKVSAKLVPMQRLNWGRIHFQAHSGCWQNLLFYDCDLEAPTFCWQSAGSYPHFLETSAPSSCPELLQAAQSSLPCGLPQNGHLLDQSSKKSPELVCQQDSVLYNVT